MNRLLVAATVIAGFAATACHKQQAQVMYEKLPVERRDITVTASATGAIEPVLTVDVKSKASGEITDMRVQTGDDIRAGQLLVVVDPRQPKNNLDQAQANLEVAQAQLQNAKAALDRADTLFKAQALTEAEHENARLTFANARAAVVRAQADLDNANDAMEDTRLKAPVSGTIIAKNVELGTVISSPTRDVGGGTVLFKMANLDTVQIRTLVDETDIGKVQPGLEATITVDAYPNRPFRGSVLKIEPQATVQQNVTMFPVLVRIENRDHLLKPGMNTEVEIHVGERRGVIAVPYASLRTQRDVASAAEVLGLDPQVVQQQLAEARQPQGGRSDSASMGGGLRGDTALARAPGAAAPAGAAGPSATISTPDGRTITIPGVTQKEADQAQAAMRKRMSGGEPTAEEQAVMRKVFQAMRASGGGGFGRQGAGGGAGGPNRRNLDTGNYIVFALKNGAPTAVPIRTGLTDLDYIEVLNGLAEGDTVLVLPTAGMLSSQKEMRERFQRMTGGGLPGVQQTPASPPRTTTTPR